MPGKPINTATKNERKLNIWERLYLPEVLKGLGWSIRKIWKEPSYTFQYPEEAIVMSKEYDLTFQDRDEAIFGLDRLLVPKERLADRLAFLHKHQYPQFGSPWEYPSENNRHSLRNLMSDEESIQTEQ